MLHAELAAVRQELAVREEEHTAKVEILLDEINEKHRIVQQMEAKEQSMRGIAVDDCIHRIR